MEAEPITTSSARRRVVLAIKISVSIILLTLLFSRIDAGRLWAVAPGHGELVPRRGVGRIAGVAAGPDGLLLVAGREARANALEAWRGW